MTSAQTIGVRDLRLHLSRYLRRVAGGEAFRVSERGKDVAFLGPLPEASGAVERLVAQGRLRKARHDLLSLGPPPAHPVHIPISQALAADRDER